MHKGNLRKHLLAMMFAVAVFFAVSGAVLAAGPYTTLEDLLKANAGDTFQLTGTSSGDTFTVTSGQSLEMAKYVKQGMSAGGSTVKSVAYTDTSVAIQLSSNPSGTTLLVTVPDNVAGSLREHDNNNTNNTPTGGGETKDSGLTGDNVPATSIRTSGPHGKFVSNTNACGRCHQLHSAQSSRLIRFKTDTSKNTIYGICTYCHSFNGQSTYDVRNGQIWDTKDGKRYATNGGGFENMLVVEGSANVATYSKVTARHAVDINTGGGSTEPVKFRAPGGNTADGSVQLKCTACHQPHGTENDRLLVESVQQGTDKYFSFAPGGTQDGLNHTPSKGDGSFTGQNGPVKVVVENAFNDEKTSYNEKIIDFCSQCHVDYAAKATLGGTDAGSTFTVGDATSTNRPSRTANGKYDQKYRHMMNMKAAEGLNGAAKVDETYGFDANNLILPLANVNKPAGQGVVVCTTCHYAHGTFTNNDSNIKTYDEINLGAEAATANYAPSGTAGLLNKLGGEETAKNLRLDDRGVCQNCHNRNPDLTKPSLIDILNPGKIVQDTTVTANGTNIATGTQAKYDSSSNTIIIRFAQYMRPVSVENTANYTVSGGVTLTSAKLQQDKRTVVLTVNTGTVTPNTSTLTVTNATNTNGQSLTAPLAPVTIK